jgi:hypothetical protein
MQWNPATHIKMQYFVRRSSKSKCLKPVKHLSQSTIKVSGQSLCGSRIDRHENRSYHSRDRIIFQIINGRSLSSTSCCISRICISRHRRQDTYL